MRFGGSSRARRFRLWAIRTVTTTTIAIPNSDNVPFAISPARGARTSVYLASSPGVADVTGKYFVRRHEARPARIATDDDAARRLWSASEALVASVPDPG